MQISGYSKLKQFADDNFEIDEIGRTFLEKNVGKGKKKNVTSNVFFSQCFHEAYLCYCRHVKTRNRLGKGLLHIDSLFGVLRRINSIPVI